MRPAPAGVVTSKQGASTMTITSMPVPEWGAFADQAPDFGAVAVAPGKGRHRGGRKGSGRVRKPNRRRDAVTAAGSVARFAGRSWRVARAVWAFARARCPKWMLPVLAVCLVIPGPVDELAVLAVVLFPVLRSAEARRDLGASVRGAWRS